MPREVKRPQTIRISVTLAEKQELQKAAEKQSMPFGIYIRGAALRLARGELKPAA